MERDERDIRSKDGKMIYRKDGEGQLKRRRRKSQPSMSAQSVQLGACVRSHKSPDVASIREKAGLSRRTHDSSHK
ncbi:hypothetical protein EVAR_36722_1 [Eumeta japonica]|uniref:Uncharacterized protein n=1 Tax=Eumeta variegata TaxID=151549 RepID=A0A4C1XQN6_EUMVA|nr:hypothetical protein EVAR_36722_1 [Eumeta japonica]